MNDTLSQAERRQLALDTIFQKPTKGIPAKLVHIMQHDCIERLAGVQPGEYLKDPDRVYFAMQERIGVCVVDQYLAKNPLSMGEHGYENHQKSATTGAKEILVDGIQIDSPESVIDHLESFCLTRIEKQISVFDEDQRVRDILEHEAALQELIGPGILKAPYGIVSLPYLRYGTYGYENYFMAYALYPEVMEKDFSLQADLCLLNNRAAARAYIEGNLPLFHRSDHDMADGRGTLVDIRSLDRIWFPHFARCTAPVIDAGVKVIWHCDGNLMEMVPRLLEVGLVGFQGFQYEFGMDYEKISAMKTRDGDDLLIEAGVSVTTTLPFGTREDVRNELRWLVEKGPKTGLFLGASSSIVPGTPFENLEVLIEGLQYYQTHGR